MSGSRAAPPPDIGDDAFLPAKPRAISGGRAAPPPDIGDDAFLPAKPRAAGPVKGPAAPVKGPAGPAAPTADEEEMMSKMGFGSFAPGRFVKKMGADKLQKSIDAEEVDMQQVHEAHRRPAGGKEELQRMMAEMAAASRGETPHTKPVGAASTGEARPAATALKAGAGEKEQASDGSDSDGDDDEEDSGEEEDMGKGGLVPCTHEAIIKASTKAITAMSIDPSAARLLTGGHDCGIKMYDFNGMNQNLNHFREVAVWEGQPLVSMQYSNSGDKILVATTKNTAVLFSREGSREADFMKGDMYVHDMAQTKGHVAALCGACWHPTDRNTCLTGSLDGTVRLWDINECNKKQVTDSHHIMIFNHYNHYNYQCGTHGWSLMSAPRSR